MAKCTDNMQLQRATERIYFAAMLLVAWVALRTVIANEGCWLIHMASIGAMVMGATYPATEFPNAERETDVELEY
jgi:hypothetical protein